MAKVLIIRFSAIGDVAMTIPVIYAAAEAHPEDSFTVLTQTFLMPLFLNRPANVSIMGVNTKTTEKSFPGFLRYVFILRKYKFDIVLDLHSVIRSWAIDLLSLISGKKAYRLDKGRKNRKKITARPPKEIFSLRAVTKRYADVFHKAGFEFEQTFASLYEKEKVDDEMIYAMAGDKTTHWVGLAPFAKHRGKIYPLDKMEEVVRNLSRKRPDITVFLFGGRGEEEKILNGWAEKYTNAESTVGRYSLDMELAFMSKLDVLVCMDSANMHFASLVGTKVISIWGATHPNAGFYGYRQSYDLAIQVPLACRPCSIYGNKPCYRGDWACMNEIAPEQIISKINDFTKGL